MQKRNAGRFTRIATLAMLILGMALIVASAFYVSSFVAIIGLAIVFWAAILLYIKPVKHVPLPLFNASSDSISGNIERVLTEWNATHKGVYLPPKNLKNLESSLVFVPAVSQTALPTSEENNEKLRCEPKKGLFLTPPGLEMCRLFERELGMSFTKTNLTYLQLRLPKLLIEDLEVAEAVELKVMGNTVVIEAEGTLFSSLCLQTNSQPRTHSQVGCLFSSAIACALAKAAGEPITIQRELQKTETKAIRVEYRIEAPIVVTTDDGVPIIFGQEPDVTPEEDEPQECQTSIPVIVIPEDAVERKAPEEPQVSIIPPAEIPVIVIPEMPPKDDETPPTEFPPQDDAVLTVILRKPEVPTESADQPASAEEATPSLPEPDFVEPAPDQNQTAPEPSPDAADDAAIEAAADTPAVQPQPPIIVEIVEAPPEPPQAPPAPEAMADEPAEEPAPPVQSEPELESADLTPPAAVQEEAPVPVEPWIIEVLEAVKTEPAPEAPVEVEKSPSPPALSESLPGAPATPELPAEPYTPPEDVAEIEFPMEAQKTSSDAFSAKKKSIKRMPVVSQKAVNVLENGPADQDAEPHEW